MSTPLKKGKNRRTRDDGKNKDRMESMKEKEEIGGGQYKKRRETRYTILRDEERVRQTVRES